MLLQPEPLPQHFLERGAHGLVLVAGDRLDLGPGGAQARFEGVGGVEQAGERPLTGQIPSRDPPDQDRGDQDDGHGGGDRHGKGECGHTAGPETGGQSAATRVDGQILRGGKGLGLTAVGPAPNISRLMSAEVPEVLDAWRMVAARRRFDGRMPLAAMARLRDLLADTEGEVRFALEFGHDTLQVPFVELQVDAELPLVCQRSLQRFLQHVSLHQRFALVRDAGDSDEDIEAALPPGYEALQVGDDGMLRPAELVEDELILAVPLVPAMPGSESVERDWPVPEDEEIRASPFAALAALKKT